MKNKEIIHVLLELIPLFKEEYRREALEQAIKIIERSDEE